MRTRAAPAVQAPPGSIFLDGKAVLVQVDLDLTLVLPLLVIQVAQNTDGHDQHDDYEITQIAVHSGPYAM
jgi:hypothetical protein